MSRLNVRTSYVSEGGEGRDPQEARRMLRHYLAAFPEAKRRMEVALGLSALGLMVCIAGFFLLADYLKEMDMRVAGINLLYAATALGLRFFNEPPWRSREDLRERFARHALIERLAAGFFENDDIVEATPWEYRWIMRSARRDSAEVVLRLAANPEWHAVDPGRHYRDVWPGGRNCWLAALGLSLVLLMAFAGQQQNWALLSCVSLLGGLALYLHCIASDRLHMLRLFETALREALDAAARAPAGDGAAPREDPQLEELLRRTSPHDGANPFEN